MISIAKNNLKKSEILRYMGYPEGYHDRDIDKLVEELIDKALEKITPTFTYMILSPVREQNDKTISFGETDSIVLSGKSVYGHLNNSEKVVCFAATLGTQAESHIKLQMYKEITSSIITDAIYNECIEAVCDKAECIIKSDTTLKGMYSTTRFSPGYGDLPLDVQPDIIRILDAQRKIGLTCSGDNLLIPRKSVTAFIGFSKNKSVDVCEQTCTLCTLKNNCKLRKDGKYCGYKNDNRTKNTDI